MTQDLTRVVDQLRAGAVEAVTAQQQNFEQIAELFGVLKQVVSDATPPGTTPQAFMYAVATLLSHSICALSTDPISAAETLCHHVTINTAANSHRSAGNT